MFNRKVSIRIALSFVIFTFLATALIAQDLAEPATAELKSTKGKSAENVIESMFPYASDGIRNSAVIWNTDIADAGTYLFATTTSGSLTDMSAGTTQLVAANADDTASAVTNIGFDFYFQGVRYSQFSVNSNGSVRLGSVATSGTAYNPLGLASSSIITAYGADQRTHTTGKVHFKVTGTAGSRVVVIEFLNMQANFSTGGTADLTYQVRLSETTGVIEFVYGPMAMSTAGAADANSNSPQFGFSSSNTTGNVGSITAAQSGAPAPTFDGATAIPVDNLYVAGAITVLDSAADGSRRTFAFTPPVPAGPTGLSFTAITPIAQTLNWTDNAVNEDLFAIYRSTDGINYSYVGSAAEDATTFNDTGLAPSTNYFYQVYAVSEGALSTVLFGSQATSAPGNDTCNGAGGVWSSAGTWTDGSVPTATDNVTIGTGCTVEVDITTAVAYNVTVNSGGTLQSPATGATTTNNLTVSNNVTNNGTLDFSTNGDTSGAILTFGAGVNDVVFNGTGATTDVRAIAIAKGARATVVELSPTNFTVQGANTDTAGFLTITSGTFKISGSFAATNRVFTAPAYSIPTLGGFWINNPNFTVAGQNGSPTTTGLLRISNGTLNVGTGAGNSMAFATGSTIIVEGGAVNVAGRFAVSAAGNAITYTQTGGIITVCTVGNTSGTLGSFDLGTGLASTITMSGGTIVTQLQATTIDYRNQAGTGIVGVTGGTLQLGNANSGAAKSFNIRGVVPNLVVDNTSAGHTGTYSTTLANYNNISRNITINTGSTLNLGNVVFLFNGTTLTNNGTLTHNGASSNTVLFTDNAPVTYTGSGSVTAPLSALGIQSTLGFTIDPASSNIPANAVRLFAGNVINSSKLTVGNGGTTTSTVQIGNTTTPTAAGTFDSQMTFNPGSGGITVSYLRTTASRVTGGEIPATRSITNLTFDDNDITHNLAVAGGDLTVTGTMTLTNGVIVTGANTLIHNGTASRTTGYVGGQLARDYTAASAYTYFVGDNGFSPVSVSATAVGSPTSLKVQAVDSTLAGFLPGQSLSRYWNLTETGDITANLSFTYDIDAADVNGSEADYRVFKREAGVNTNLCISGPCVNSATNTLGPVVGVTDFSSWTGAENGASDTIAPDTTITSNPTDPSPSADATFDFTGTDSAIASVASFECQIDGGGYTACTSPKTYTGLSDGSHTFNVRAIDTAGNVDASPASYTWTISTAPLGPVSVTATAGTPGPTDYATLKAAFDAVNAGTHQGVITVSILGDTTETASAVLNESGSGSASYSAISIKPTGGAARTISGDIAGHLVDLNGADNVTIDGLNTGGNSLTISNVSQQTTASTIRFNNDATGNTVTNSTVSGSTGAALSSGFGVIYFGAATVTGNDNNTISNNNITAAGSNLPINGIFSQNLTAATDNSSITISGNNISNFFNTNSASSAVNVNSGNSGWTVSNNKIFQTGTRTYLTAATHNGVFVTSGSGYTVTGNTIGYAAANGTGIYTMTGTVLTRFVAINLAVGTAATTSVQGNTVASISIAGIGINSGNGSLAGVNIASGNVNVGDITPNTFGATSGTGSLTATPTTTVAAAIVGVNSASTGDVVISNNTFGSFTSAGPAATNPGAAFGINVSGAAASISITGNTFGNATAENIRAGVLGTTTGSSIAGGIIQTAVPSVFNYSNNTIQNISAYGTGTGGYVRGIQTGTTSSATATGTINNNTITNLTTSGALSGQSNGNSSAQGIQFMAGVNSTVSGNSISNISNVNAGVVGTVVAGIVHASGTNTVISNNRIWGLSNASTATSLTLPNVISGIVIRSGTTAVTVQNNMISVGNGQATNSYVFGIWGNHGSTPDPLDKVYFNTVNIEGTVASGAAPSAGFHRGDLTATNKNPAVDVRNNIFVNSRSGGTGKHYAIANHIGGASSNATGWSTVNNNVLNANASTIGYWTTDQTFAGWKLASSGDSLSYSNIPVTFVNNVSDLHLNMGVTPTSIESGGVAIAGITTDIDGQTRPGPTGSVNGGAIAPDIGADEFDGVYLDGSAPIITYSALSSVTSTTNRTLSVNITDGTGVAGGGNAPRVYFKKLADATYASTACSFASGTPQNGTYNCVIDYSLVGGGAVVTGDTVQYFVVAQDLVGNLSSNPSVGFTGTDVNTVTTPPTTPNAYMISAPFTGMYTVGSGGTYPSLTNAGGIFEAINSGVVTGNITIEIVSDMAGETGAVSLNQTTEEGAGNYTITIKPTGAPRVITGSSTTWIIRFADADRVTIDGSLSGGTANAVGGDAALRNLTIQNTSTTATGGAVIVMSSVSNGAQNNTIKNVNISGQDATQTLIGVHIGGATVGSAGGPNNNARIENCSFQKSIIGIYDAGASAAAQNSGNVVTMNDLSATGANKLRRAGMLFFNQDSLQVSMNSVGGIANDESGDSYGIGVGIQAYDATTVLSGAITNSLISRNKVNGVASTNTVGYSIAGIGISGGTTGANIVANNMVSGVMAPSTSPDITAGIYIAGAAGSNTKLYFNSVSMTGDRGVVSGQIGSYAVAITGVDPAVELKDNIFYTTQTSGGGANAKSYALGMVTTAFANLDSNYNNFVSTGANAGGFRTGGIGTSGTDSVSLAAWQTLTLKDANSLELDPMFVDPMSDLHIPAASPMTNAGSAAGGITVDFDGDTRPATPAIGADEVDVTAPDTQILTGPANPTSSANATFTFSGTDSAMSAVASFECQLDGSGFAACTSPASYMGLSDGMHNFQVRAKDGAGNVDPTPATYLWTVDLTGPDTTILTNPTNPSNSSSATFTFTGTDTLLGIPALSFECQIDGGGYSACSSPKTYTGLADGSHTFDVRAKDSAGNVDPSPATYTWNIVTAATGPVSVTATAGTPGPIDYPTLKDAFDAINAGTHQGAVTVSVVSNTTETAPAVLNSNGAGTAAYTSVLVRPVNDGVTVSGATVAGRGLVELNGADNVTIDGDNPNTAGTNRNLTFTNTAANTVAFTSVIRIAVAATVVTSADGDTIKNVHVIGNATGRNISTATSTTGSENTVFGIYAGPGASTASATTAPSAITSVSTSVGAGATATNLTITNNSIATVARGVTVNGSATTVFPGLLINNNEIGNQTAGAADQVTSIGITAQGSANGVISGNTVWVEGYVASSTATHGINVGVNSAIGTFTIDSNKVNRTRNSNSGSWSAFGINLGGGSNHIVQNNFVSGVINDQTAGTGAFSTSFGAFGIRVASGTGHKIYHNSVNLYGPMGGVTSSLLTASFGVTSTTLTGIDVRNNVFANTISGGNPAGTRNVAVFLPSAATAAMNLTDNNNAYFVGTDPNNRLAQVGTTFGTGEYTVAAFDPTATVPASNFRSYTSTLSAAGTNDNLAFASTALAPFTSATNLHIPNATATPLESAGATVGVLTDIDGETRPNGSAPDLGADEFVGTPPPANDIAAATILVPVNASTVSTGTAPTPQATFTNVGSATQTGVGVSFTISGPGGYSYTDPQVIATIAPFQSVTVTFSAAPTITTPGAYTMSAAVTTADSNAANDVVNGGFNAAAPLGGTYTVGGGGNFASLTNPGGLFEQLNLLGAGSNVTADITTDLTAETGAIQLNQLPGGFGLTIKPSGAPRTISGNGASLALIKLYGADNVTIDGSLSGGTDRSLTITYGNTGGTVIWIQAASAANGALGTTIKNTNISGNTGTTIISGILSGSGVTLGGPAESPNSNTTIENNWIYRVQNAIYSQGAVAFDQNWNITGNTFGSTVAADKNSFRGMLIGNVQNFVINGNTISGISSAPTTTAAMSGIQLAFAINGGTIANNVIRDIRNNSASGTGAYGINMTSTSAAANVTIANNSVSDIAALGSATVLSNGFGINFNAAGASGYKLYHNSVNMNANQSSGTTAALQVAAVSTAGAIDAQNNIFANTQTSGATRYAVYSTSPASVFSPINYNDYFAANVGFVGGSARVTLGDWQTATTQDANSQAVDPLFLAPTNLHISAGSPMIDAAVTIPTVTTDFDGQTRPIGAANDIGADEWVATISISGRVLTSDGQGIKNAIVTLTDSGMGPKRTTLTGAFGYYSFTGQPSNVVYTVAVSSKRFTFTPNFQSVGGYADITDFDFVADPLP